ncbi:hypothetical protein HHK36_003136 [Tetracentron sinense]|uniref:CCHC-type domain-containing protein n=1 Tax=Tetracentron sinense TaxID=13715 RepID=A0A834ZN78_TETSI|nr:hypothetical protein HHK36_003136 [Tetracentron sinense]
MASSSLLSPSLPLQLPAKRRASNFSACNLSFRTISASLLEIPPPSAPPPTVKPKLPIRKIPGDYGLPIIGPIKDRLDYFKGREDYFKSRMQKYQSTVFRANMPPGPFIASNTNVVVLLDGKSFPVLFDVSKVEKRDLFTGTYMPSTDLTGGYRLLSYLDPSEPSHAKLKRLVFFLLKSRRDKVLPEFQTSFSDLFETLESELAAKGKAAFGEANEQACFNFLARSFYGANPAESKLDLDGPKLIGKWVLFQLSPLLTLGLPKLLEELLLHTFPLPPFLVKSDYQKLYDFFYESSGRVLDEAEKMGIDRDEACHNLLFITCFNTFGGMKIFFPNVLKWIGRAGVKLHSRLAKEIRSAVRTNGGKVTMAAMEQMPLMKSVVYEAFRIEPPVSLQYGRAKRDLVIESHDSAFEVKEGELMFGFQPFATRDPKIFERGEEFVADRFIGEGEKLLKHVLWSNGPETENPTVDNKQCAGKDFVVLVSRLLVVEIFLRYNSFEIEVGTSPLVTAVHNSAFISSETFWARAVQLSVAKKTTIRAWNTKSRVSAIDLENDFILFHFSDETEMTRVMQHQPWSFNGHPLLLKRWSPDILVKDLRLNQLPVWMQIHGIPPEYITEEVGALIADRVGDLVEVDIPKFGVDRFLGLASSEKELFPVTYEKLPTVCYSCGCMGHDAKHCVVQIPEQGSLSDDCTVDYAPAEIFGPWLRSEQFHFKSWPLHKLLLQPSGSIGTSDSIKDMEANVERSSEGGMIMEVELDPSSEGVVGPAVSETHGTSAEQAAKLLREGTMNLVAVRTVEERINEAWTSGGCDDDMQRSLLIRAEPDGRRDPSPISKRRVAVPELKDKDHFDNYPQRSCLHFESGGIVSGSGSTSAILVSSPKRTVDKGNINQNLSIGLKPKLATGKVQRLDTSDPALLGSSNTSSFPSFNLLLGCPGCMKPEGLLLRRAMASQKIEKESSTGVLHDLSC